MEQARPGGFGGCSKRSTNFPATSRTRSPSSWKPSSPSTPTAADVAPPAPFRSPENFCRRRSGHRKPSRHRAPPPIRFPFQPFFPRPPRRDPAGGGKRVRLRRSVAKPSAGGARSRRRDSARPSGGPGATRAGAEPAFPGTGHGRRPGTLERKARRVRRAEPARSATTAPAPRDRGAVAQGGMDKRGGSGAGRGPVWDFGGGAPRPAKPSPAPWSPRAPGSCADAIRTYCATPPRGARSHRTASPGPQGRGCVGGAQRRPHAQCALWQRRRAGSRGRDRRRETRARRDVRRLRGITFRRGRGGAAWHDPLRGGRGRVFYGVEALVWRLNTKYRADPNPRRSQSSGSTARTPHDIDLSRLNSAAWVLAVYASCPPRGRTTQHSLPAVRLQTLPGGIPTHWAPAQSFLHSLAFVVTRSWFPSVCALLGAMTPFFLRGTPHQDHEARRARCREGEGSTCRRA